MVFCFTYSENLLLPGFYLKEMFTRYSFQKLMPNKRRSAKRAKRPPTKMSLLSSANSSKGLYPMRINIRGTNIPRYTNNPHVQRIVRLSTALSSVNPTYNLTFSTFADLDQLEYSAGSARYSTIRISWVKFWLETPPTTALQPSYGAVITDVDSNMTFTDRCVGTISYAAVGYVLPFSIRQTIQLVSSTIPIATIGTDLTIPVGTLLNATVDALCEFA
jgi:hypothetical protein